MGIERGEVNHLEDKMTREQVGQVRDRLEQELRSQADHIQKLVESAQSLLRQHHRLEETTRGQFEALQAGRGPASGAQITFEKLLSSVRNLITATDAEQVFESLTDEAEQMAVRAAVFDIRGRAAWGFVAKGFDKGVTAKALRALVVPLNQDNPFRRVYEIGGHVDLTVNDLRRNRNVANAFKPSPESPILLLPIRSAGSVTAIFYCDPKDSGGQLPVDALKILTEFAGAQIDRLMALAGEIAVRPEAAESSQPEETPKAGETAEPEAPPAEAEVASPEPEHEPAPAGAMAEPVAVAEPAASEPPPAPPMEPLSPPQVVAEASPAPAPVEAVSPLAPAPSSAAPDLEQLSEADQKVHKDAKRFAKLLVSEIELYNKAKVAEARKNKELYHRLKSDIDRSRQTYNKRFENALGKQYDYFHEEVVRLLADNDPSALGADYPGPAA